MKVTSIFSNRNSIEDKSIIIKPDMSLDERTKETLLLKERWSLIQSGIGKSDIKIKSSSIYVKWKIMATFHIQSLHQSLLILLHHLVKYLKTAIQHD